MRYGSLILEKREYVYIKQLLNIGKYNDNLDIITSISTLKEELKTAHIVDEEEMPDDIIRINSYVSMTTSNGLHKTLQLVQPAEKDHTLNKISILSSLGLAIIGYSTHDNIKWKLPSGNQKLKINDVQQENTYCTVLSNF